MARFTIYDKDGNVRHESITGYTGDGQQVYADSLEYNGSWMGECFLTVSVKSAYPIDFHTGDYIDYRGERFTLNYDPGVVKKSRRGTYGEGFTYDSIKFTARHTELSEIRFLDYVLDDNHLHYTSLPEFPFYAASIDDYCDRLQANTNRWCKSNGLAVEDYWLFLTPSTNQQGYPEKTVQRAVSYGLSAAVAHQRWLDAYGQGTYIDEEKRDVSVSVSQQSVWDSLSLIKSDFGLNFITRGRQVIIGAAGLPTSHLFKYGKDNGLYEIERIADTEQAVITKMYAYGSESNMPTRYYANLNTECSATFTGGLVMNASLDYGYKGNVWMTSVPWKPSVYTNRQNTDAFVRIEFISGNLEGERTMALATPIPRSSEDAAEQGVAQMTGIFLLQELGKNPSAGSVVKILSGVDKDKWDTAHRITPENLPNNMAVNRLMLPGFPKKSLYDWVIANGGTAESDAANDDNIGKATWRGYTAFFSKDKYQPYILSVNFKELGIREATEMFDGTDDNEDIYPTIEGTGYDEIYAAETIRDNGVFAEGENEPTVTITLPSFGDGFYLRELVETGDSPKIVMRNGYCGSREFEIQSVREVSGRWECKCKREYDDLLDIWFPYSYAVSQGGTAKADEPYQVCAGDKYVLTGIAMTDTYIEASAVRLLEASLLLLSKNDYTRYTYLPKVDEIYMARQHESHEENNERSLYETVKEGDIMLFKDDDLGIDGSVFIDTLRIKENGNNGIPTYDVTLRNDKQVGTLQRIQNKIDSLSSLVNAGGGGLSVAQIRELISTYGGGLFLSKLNADTARGVITFLQGLQVGGLFTSGILGEGGVFRRDADGKTYIEADKLYVRMKAYFDNVEIRDYQHTSGNRIASQARGFTASRVEWLDTNGDVLERTDGNLPSVTRFRVYWRAKDDEHETQNQFIVGDQAFSDYSDVTDGSLVTRRYWRVVVGRNVSLTDDGEAWVDLSNKKSDTISYTDHQGVSRTKTVEGYEQGSSIPEAEDDICQLGNVWDTERQGAVIEYVGGENAPSYQIYQGIDSFSLNGKNYVSLGYNSQTGRAYMNVYGDAYIGDPNGGTYVKYDQGKGELSVKAKLDALSTIGDQSIDEYIKAHQDKGWTKDEIEKIITDSTDSQFRGIDTAIETLQRQADGAIETWYYDGAPTLSNSPAKDWTTDNAKDTHIGDLYYDKSTGYGYRFMKDGGAYKWELVRDTGVTQALADAKDAHDLADGKRRIFVKQPTNADEYDEGDIWVNATYGGAYNNDILRCKTAKAKGAAFNISHWQLASKYTDDSAVDALKANTYVTQLLNGQISTDIANAAKSYEDAALAAIKQALSQGTTVDGGLVLSTLIGLRDSDNKVWSGINGAYDSSVKGGGIAAWYGGAMVDHEVDDTATYYAKSLFRFDGSGYLAAGNISWTDKGQVTIKDLYTLIGGNASFRENVLNKATLFANLFHTSTTGTTVGTDTKILPQAAFQYINISRGTEDLTANSVLTLGESDERYLRVSFFERLFNAYNGTKKVDANDNMAAIDSIKAMFGFWTEKYISALGKNDDTSSSGSATTLRDLLDVSLGTLSNGQVLKYNSSTGRWVNGTDEGVTSLGWANITGKPTTIAGYGITDAKIADGTITIGGNSITPLTSHQSLSGYATQSWVTSNFNKYVLPTATASDLGGIKVGYTTSAKNYKVQLDTDGNAYVNVPWTDNNTTYSFVNKAATLAWDTAVTVATVGGTDITVKLPANPNTNTWRGIRNNLTSTSTTDSLSAYQGYLLANGSARDNTKLPLSGGTMSNTNLVTNLNADLLDGRHGTSYMYWEGDLNKNNMNDIARSFYSASGMTNLASSSVDNGDMTGWTHFFNTSYRYGGNGSNSWVFQLACVAGTSNLQFRSRNGGTVTNGTAWTVGWTKILHAGNIGSYNAGSATKLQTARTLWGQSFNGSANVSGTMTGVGSICTASAPASTVYMNNWFRSISNTGWLNQTFYGGIYMTDSTWIRIFNNKKFFTGATDTDAIYTTGGVKADKGFYVGNASLFYSDDETILLSRKGTASYYAELVLDSDEPCAILRNFSSNSVSGSITIDGDGWVRLRNAVQGTRIDLTEEIDVYGGVLRCRNGMYSDTYVSALGQNTSSDIRRKDVTGNVKLSVDSIASAPMVRYTWRDNRDLGLQVGSIAQYWETVLPEAVHDGEDGYKTMQYGVIALLASISTARKVVDHERRIKELEKENERLRTEVEQLRIS